MRPVSTKSRRNQLARSTLHSCALNLMIFLPIIILDFSNLQLIVQRMRTVNNVEWNIFSTPCLLFQTLFSKKNFSGRFSTSSQMRVENNHTFRTIKQICTCQVSQGHPFLTVFTTPLGSLMTAQKPSMYGTKKN